jgi:hypothetical protein
MFLPAVSVLVVVQLSSEVSEGLINNPVHDSCSYMFRFWLNYHQGACSLCFVKLLYWYQLIYWVIKIVRYCGRMLTVRLYLSQTTFLCSHVFSTKWSRVSLSINIGKKIACMLQYEAQWKVGSPWQANSALVAQRISFPLRKEINDYVNG